MKAGCIGVLTGFAGARYHESPLPESLQTGIPAAVRSIANLCRLTLVMFLNLVLLQDAPA
jgi:hypothetical protein